MGHRWDFITDYETDPSDIVQPELKYLAAVGLEHHERLKTLEAFSRFNERLNRKWAIETGLIEHLYSFDRGVTQLLIERGIDAALIPHRDDQQPESVAAMIQRRRDALIEEWKEARSIAHKLREVAEGRLRAVCTELQRHMPSLLNGVAFFVDGATDHGEKSHYFASQVVEAAKELGYYANREIYRSWARLVFENEDADCTELLVTFHGLGHEFQGVLACTAVCFQRNATEAGEPQVTSGEPVCEGVFQINYKEPVEEATARFMTWLEPSLVRAVELWQATL